MKTGRPLTFIDLFAGAGGLSEGFIQAGYRPIAHVEMNPAACETLKTRAAYHYLKEQGQLHSYTQYLKKEITKQELYNKVPSKILDSVICKAMSDSSMPEIYGKIDNCLQEDGIKAVDVLIGGPPCQAFSLIGRARTDMSQDPRNDLYRLYLDVLQKYKPKAFVFENVPGLKTAKGGTVLQDIKKKFNELGYESKGETLHAEDYGVLQKRRRYIIVGWKKGLPLSFPSLQKRKQTYWVHELFDDLEPMKAGDKSTQYATRTVPEGYLKDFHIREDGDVLTWQISRHNTPQDLEIYRLTVNEWDTTHKRLKYTDLPPELKTHHNQTSFLDRFKVVEGNQHACHTMVAHISKDGHYFIHPDIKQNRSITVREAARIQSFPDNFFFEGSRTAAFTQIGNAVPPLFAKAIAEALKNELTKESPIS